MELGKQGVKCSRETPTPACKKRGEEECGQKGENNQGIRLKKRAVGSPTNGKEIGAGVGWGPQTGQIIGAK